MTELTNARNAIAEAMAVVPDGMTARVLEPSRPAVDDGDFFADDPTALDGADPETTLLPVGGAGTTWENAAAAEPSLADFARSRWLGPWDRLGPVPDGYQDSRADFHRLAYAVMGPARYETNGKFGLRFTAGGFGTPFFGDDRQVRMVGNVLVDQVGDEVRLHTPTTLADAAQFLGVEISTVAAEGDVPDLGPHDRTLQLDPATGDFLGDWFGFTVSVLEELRAETSADAKPSRVQLWPGHFDPAVEIGDQDKGHRASIGGSPGDHNTPEPYLYVGPWGPVPDNDYWNAEGFTGAAFHYTDILAADDQRAAALDFLRTGVRLLAEI